MPPSSLDATTVCSHHAHKTIKVAGAAGEFAQLRHRDMSRGSAVHDDCESPITCSERESIGRDGRCGLREQRHKFSIRRRERLPISALHVNCSISAAHKFDGDLEILKPNRTCLHLNRSYDAPEFGVAGANQIPTEQGRDLVLEQVATAGTGERMCNSRHCRSLAPARQKPVVGTYGQMRPAHRRQDATCKAPSTPLQPRPRGRAVWHLPESSRP